MTMTMTWPARSAALAGTAVIAICACIASLALSSVAHASCAGGPGAFTLWPKADARDVPVDTPIAVSRYWLGGDPKLIKTKLTAADGTELALEETRLLPPPYAGCTGDTLFLKPAQKLKAGETFTLTHSTDSKGMLTQTRFTVGGRVSEPEADVTPDIKYLRVYSKSECVKTPCSDDVANVRVDFGEPPPQPLWLRVTGSGSGDIVNDWVFYPSGYNAPEKDPEWFSKTQLSVPLAPGESCVELQIYGVEGRPLLEEKRCAPDRCAVYAIRSSSSAGGPWSAPVDVDKVPDGSCKNPPVLDGPGDPSEIRYPELSQGVGAQGDGGAAASPDGTRRRFDKQAFDGCSVSRAGSAGYMRDQGQWLALSMLALLFARIGRRRKLHHQE